VAFFEGGEIGLNLVEKQINEVPRGINMYAIAEGRG